MQTLIFGTFNKKQAQEFLFSVSSEKYYYKLEMKKHRFNFDFKCGKSFYYYQMYDVLKTIQSICFNTNVLVSVRIYKKNHKDKYKCIQKIVFNYINK